MTIISIAVIKNNLDKISRNARLSCPGFIEPMTSVLHHSCHDRIVRIGAIELRKKPVLPSPAWIRHAAPLCPWRQNTVMRVRVTRCGGAVVLLLSAVVAWLQVHQPRCGSGSLLPASQWWHWLGPGLRSYSHTACNLWNPNWIIESFSKLNVSLSTVIQSRVCPLRRIVRNGQERRQASGSHKSCL